MSKKTRYLLLLTGFIFFLILAPLAVLYVRGITYDFVAKKFVETGIVSVKSEPKNVNVFFNDKLARVGSGDIKFVLPGEYKVQIKKEGYETWQKRLTVEAGQVAYAGLNGNAIYLFYSSPQAQTISQGVLDFSFFNKNLAYLSDASITLTTLANPAGQQSFVLPKKVNKIIGGDGSGNFLLENSDGQIVLLLNSGQAKFTDLSLMFAGATKWQLAQNGDLYALNSGTVYKINPAEKTKQAVMANVKTFFVLGPSLYAVANNAGVLSLELSQAPFSQTQVLVSGVPSFLNGDLLVTSGKQVFLLADGSLYKANLKMEKIADNISESNFNSGQDDIALFHFGEFDYYASGSGETLSFVTRSGENLKNLNINTGIGYAFYSNSSGLTAIELDTRDNQNQYILYPGKTIQKFSLDDAGKNIVLLDNNQLKSLVVR